MTCRVLNGVSRNGVSKGKRQDLTPFTRKNGVFREITRRPDLQQKGRGELPIWIEAKSVQAYTTDWYLKNKTILDEQEKRALKRWPNWKVRTKSQDKAKMHYHRQFLTDMVAATLIEDSGGNELQHIAQDSIWWVQTWKGGDTLESVTIKDKNGVKKHYELDRGRPLDAHFDALRDKMSNLTAGGGSREAIKTSLGVPELVLSDPRFASDKRFSSNYMEDHFKLFNFREIFDAEIGLGALVDNQAELEALIDNIEENKAVAYAPAVLEAFGQIFDALQTKAAEETGSAKRRRNWIKRLRTWKKT